MLKLTHRRDLLVAPACHPRGQGHLSAASGLVQVGARCYVVADDENHIGALDPDGNDPVQLLRVLEGDLPDDKKARKAAKADLETLVALRPTRAWPAGALFAIGSGSRPNRRRGVVLPLAGDGGIVVAARRVVDLAPLYAALSSELATLNIEGAVVAGDDFVLLHRGNGVGGVNACIAYDAAQLLAWLGPATARGGRPSRARSRPMRSARSPASRSHSPTRPRCPEADGCSARWPKPATIPTRTARAADR